MPSRVRSQYALKQEKRENDIGAALEPAATSKWRQLEMRGDRCPHVSERVTSANRLCANVRRPGQHWDLFARVVCSWPCRITSVVSSDDNEIVRLHPAKQLGQATIEILQSTGVAGGVATVTIDRVEID